MRGPSVGTEDECRLGGHLYPGAVHLAQSLFINLAVAAHHGVAPFWDVDDTGLTVGIEDDNDVAPGITTGMVFQAEGNETTLS